MCPVVGIGASAGGLEAFVQLLQNLPENSGMAFVLVQHLDPHHESILAEILGRHTPMPLQQATEGSRVAPNHVYVIPPNTTMVMQDCILRLTPRGHARLRHFPIDQFLTSLAESHRSLAVGVILSGSASDGTIGLKAIKQEGGITFAQDETAKFDSMPRNAVAAGAVDFVLPPDAIARQLARIASHFAVDASIPDTLVEDGPVLQRVFAILRGRKNVDFTHYKAPTIKRRLSRRMALHGLVETKAYVALLEKDASEVDALFDDLLINVTEFFRDPEVFQFLSQTIFPLLCKERNVDDTLRFWVPGCSTGEEVYSIAICLSEYMESTGQVFPAQIFGTDISERAVQTARAGIFDHGIASAVSAERLGRFFVKREDGNYQISRSIRELCLFSRHDVTNDAPLSRIDLISCRNLLIYFGSILQRRVLSTFSYALQPSGCLLLGNSESLGSLSENFIALDPDHKIYSRDPMVPAPGISFNRVRQPVSNAPSQGDRTSTEALSMLDDEANRIVALEYGPSGLFVDANHQVVKFRGNVGAYLGARNGVATLDLFEIVRKELLAPLQAAFNESAAKNSPAGRERVQYNGADQSQEINILVRPISRPGTERCFLILFEEPPQHNQRDSTSSSGSGSPVPVERELTEELASTRAYLQALIEQLRTANEEAQSSNEELQSTNEELQTAKEELQSANEELITTNEEMKSRNAELSEVNGDLLNLLSSMRVPVVMLSKELRIRRFTPLAEKALNLIATDVGRPITDLKPRINVPDLERLLAEVIYSVSALEREVQDRDGRWYSMRINPYRTIDNRVEGAVLQLLDIDQLKQTVQASEHARNYSSAIFETVREPLVVLDSSLVIQRANRSFFDTFSVSPEETLNRTIFEVNGQQWDKPRLHQLLNDIVDPSAQTEFHDVEIEYDLPGAGVRTFQLGARLIRRDGAPGQILLALEDITDRKRVAEAKYRRLFETAKDGILIIDGDSGEITDVNARILDLFECSRAELIGKLFWEAGPIEGVPDGRAVFERLRSEELVRLPDLSVKTRSDRHIEIEALGNMYREGEKRVVQFNIRDITERKQLDRKLQQTAKLESLGLLAGGIAHDFNNLLTGIMGNASLVLDRLGPSYPDRTFLREIVKATQRAADLTRQMLAYSGRGRFVVDLIDLSELIHEISSLVRSSVPKNVEIELNLAGDLPPVKADAAQIQQLVMNLIINGAEAIEEQNRGCVTVTTARAELDSESIRRDHPDDEMKPGVYVRFEVTDTGVGMDEATCAKIFDPFFTTKFTGRGLGLSAALGIVKGHGGSIRVYSRPGSGTTFTILLPASPKSRVTAPPVQHSRDLHGQGLVLVVDDEEMVLTLAEATLTRYGYEVLTAANGEVGVEMVRERGAEIDLVILDLTMPVMGGEQALAKMRALRPSLPVILSSGYDRREAETRFSNQDLSGFIQKPYTVDALLEAVKSAMRK